jgi:sugar phosphate isomerase/epimerase
MISRRTFGLAALGSFSNLAARAKIDSVVQGVRIGVSGYSFKALSLDSAIQAMKDIGLGASEVWFCHIEPKLSREELRTWRLSVPLETFRAVRDKYNEAGIETVAYTFDMKDDFSDAELDRGFRMATALGVNRIATSTTFTVATRLAPLMERYGIEVAFHGHANAADPNQFAGPESFKRVLEMSRYAKINLDIGQFTAAGFDPVAFIREQHANIPVLHIRDGRKGQGTKLPWGDGNTPIKEVLQLLKRERYPIFADIEYDYEGVASGTVAEIEKCFRYCKSALA